jgi:hydrogenase nickel incorporation protein HypA/HybF
MHELSLAKSLIDLAEENLRAAGVDMALARVATVRLQVGALSGVVPDALRFGFEIAAKGTWVEGASLEIEEVPAVVFCDACAAEHALPDLLDLRCPVCASGRSRVVRGREMTLESLEVIDSGTESVSEAALP